MPVRPLEGRLVPPIAAAGPFCPAAQQLVRAGCDAERFGCSAHGASLHCGPAGGTERQGGGTGAAELVSIRDVTSRDCTWFQQRWRSPLYRTALS